MEISKNLMKRIIFSFSNTIGVDERENKSDRWISEKTVLKDLSKIVLGGKWK